MKLNLKNYLKSKRQESGLSQNDLSELMGWTTPQYASNFERGVSLPPFETLEKLCLFINADAKLVYQLRMNEEIKRVKEKYRNKI